MAQATTLSDEDNPMNDPLFLVFMTIAFAIIGGLGFYTLTYNILDRHSIGGSLLGMVVAGSACGVLELPLMALFFYDKRRFDRAIERINALDLRRDV